MELKAVTAGKAICLAAALAACALPAHAADDCRPTETNIEGPYYVPDAPFRATLVAEGDDGARLDLEGRIYGSDCRTPLAGAVVELWQAGPDGAYDFSGAFRWRGRTRTDAEGRYAFQTVLPGRYGSGGAFRPAHLHLRVSHSKGRTLITQIYFKDDPYLRTDPFVRESLVIPLDRFKEKGRPRYRGVFTVILDNP